MYRTPTGSSHQPDPELGAASNLQEETKNVVVQCQLSQKDSGVFLAKVGEYKN